MHVILHSIQQVVPHPAAVFELARPLEDSLLTQLAV